MPPTPGDTMPRPACGFTLIEQIVALAITGAAAAAALPALAELQAQADSTALHHLASAAGSAMALNYAGCLVTNQAAVPGKCQVMANCSQVGALLQAGLPEGYRVLPQALPAQSAQSAHAARPEMSCQVLNNSNGAGASFRAYPTGA